MDHIQLENGYISSTQNGTSTWTDFNKNGGGKKKNRKTRKVQKNFNITKCVHNPTIQR